MPNNRSRENADTTQGADSPAKPRQRAGRYDAQERRRSKRAQRERGCWVYIPQDELLAAGFEPGDPPPFYKLTGRQRSANGRSVVVSLYTEP